MARYDAALVDDGSKAFDEMSGRIRRVSTTLLGLIPSEDARRFWERLGKGDVTLVSILRSDNVLNRTMVEWSLYRSSPNDTDLHLQCICSRVGEFPPGVEPIAFSTKEKRAINFRRVKDVHATLDVLVRTLVARFPALRDRLDFYADALAESAQ